MMKEILQKVTNALPLNIEHVEWNDSIFHVGGANWNFVTTSAWRIAKDGVLTCGCFDQESETLIQELKNKKIIAVEIQSRNVNFDPVFKLSDGSILEVFSTTYYEPWTFDFSSGTMYVAAPDDPKEVDVSI